MGSPAARLGDPTVHGGTIVVGLPTVLIGGQPAARIGDMHVCPLVTVLVPHVGGPLILGSFTVLTGFVPQSRVGDFLICIGPPDAVAMGCPTVLVGMAGGGMGLGAILGGLAAGLGNFLSPPNQFGPGPISEAAADQLFHEMANQPDVAFKFPADGCYARAHIMVKRMQLRGATPGKVWSFASERDDPLWVNTANDPRGKVEWGYHVAPTIQVRREDGSVRDMVVDPSMFDRPVTVQEWTVAQHDHPVVVNTKDGEAPIPELGGSGYWPSSDPPEGPDEHAEETMLRYKRCEGSSAEDCD